MVMDNPEVEGAMIEESSSEDNGQVAEPSLQDVLQRFEQSEALWQSRFNDLYDGVQSITQREAGRIAARIVSLETALGDVQSKSELTHRLVSQGYDKEQIDEITNAVKAERRVQELEAKANMPPAVDPTTDDHVLAMFWNGPGGADTRLLERAFNNGIVSSASVDEMVDAQGHPRPGKEEELALYKSIVERPLTEPRTLAALQRAERAAAKRLDDLGDKQRKKDTPASPPSDRPLGTSPNGRNDAIWAAYGRGEREFSDPAVRAAGKALGAIE